MLNIHADGQHSYFDQFRAFETWAAGAVVVAESSPATQAAGELATLGITPGVHAAFAPLESLPALCRELLADAPRRQGMTQSAQELLRASFSPAHWRGEMLAAVAQAAGHDAPQPPVRR